MLVDVKWWHFTVGWIIRELQIFPFHTIPTFDYEKILVCNGFFVLVVTILQIKYRELSMIVQFFCDVDCAN